jgi:hypothetical protein
MPGGQSRFCYGLCAVPLSFACGMQCPSAAWKPFGRYLSAVTEAFVVLQTPAPTRCTVP